MVAIINGLILTIINMASIIIGAFVYYLTKSQTNIAIQIIVGCFFSVTFFLIWEFVSHRFFKKVALNERRDYWRTYLISLLVTPIFFIPLNYFALIPWQNIAGIWLFQVPTNFLILEIYKNFSKVLALRNKLREVPKE